MDACGRPPPPNSSPSTSHRVQQPKPQALPSRQAARSILVSPRQKGNPILNHIKSVPWEYSDIPADYVLGATTCALFLSLKYHRLHPEYIYSRIRALAGKYRLRLLLTMVDIENHEDPVKELSKTSLINHQTLILCWSAAEAGRYLSLFKTYENAAPTLIRAPPATSYSEKVVEFVTVPRSINKTDAISLLGNFGSLRAAVNAPPEEIALVGGWGDKKVSTWCSSMRDGFRAKKTRKRGVPGLSHEMTLNEWSQAASRADREDVVFVENDDDDNTIRKPKGVPIGMLPSREAARGESHPPARHADAHRRPEEQGIGSEEDIPMWEPGSDEEDAVAQLERPSSVVDKPGSSATNIGSSQPLKQGNRSDKMGEGIMAALAKLRQNGRSVGSGENQTT